MTFYEAAIEVLTQAQRPLHYKKITEIAIKRNLLSHVGKTPEITMGARLAQEVKKGGLEGLLVRTRPGVFGLRAWHEHDRALHSRLRLQAREAEGAHDSDEDEHSPEEEHAKREPLDVNDDDQPDESDHDAPLDEAIPVDPTQITNPNERRTLPHRFRSELARATYLVLDERQASMGLEEIAESIRDDEDTGVSSDTISSALKAENTMQVRRGHFPLFHVTVDRQVSLVEWQFSDRVRSALKNLLLTVHQLHAACDDSLLKELTSADPATGESLLLALFAAHGFDDLHVLKRSKTQSILTGLSQRSLTPRGRVAFLWKHGGAPVCDRDVIKLRSRLHHYGAHSGVVVTSGGVDRGAHREAEVENLAPVSILTGDDLIATMRHAGLGVRSFSINFALPDLSEFRRSESPSED